MSKNLFVTGTGTDVGKTFVTGLMVKKLRESGADAAYYKAAMSGNSRRADGSLIPGDACYVKKISGISQPEEEMCPYVYEQAVSPHLAAKWEGNPVDMAVVVENFRRVCETHEYVTMEGSGGILCPIRLDDREEFWLPEVIRACGLNAVIVADAGLGTINHVGLTVFYMKAQGIEPKGIILNHFCPGDPLQEDNRRMCGHLTGVPVVACVEDGAKELDIAPEELMALYE